MSDFEIKVREVQEKALAILRRWDKEKLAKEIMREYLSEEGMLDKSKTKLDELLDQRHKLALSAIDENIKLKAIDSGIAMAAGSEKMAAVQNNQYNFGDFLNTIKDKDA